MKVLPHNPGFALADGAGELALGEALYVGYGAEALKELGGGFLADAGNVFQLVFEGAFAAQLSVEGDAVVVYLVADAADEEVRGGVEGEVERLGVAGKKDAFFFFGEAYNGHLPADVELVNAFHGGGELAFAAVYDYELGQGFFLA